MLKEEKQAIMAEYALHEGDTGSPEVQIALLTRRINDLTEHLKIRRLTLRDTVLSSQDSASVSKFAVKRAGGFFPFALHSNIGISILFLAVI